MRGMVFTEFLEFVATAHGEDLVDDMIEECDLPSGGAYTAVGNYDHAEILAMIGYMHEATGQPVPEMVHGFGEHLFARFAEKYPRFISRAGSAMEFLESIETHIHTEVRKLYPDAELPRFDCERPDPDTLVMVYSSSRPFADLAHGLIEGAIAYFKEKVTVTREDLPVPSGTAVRFRLQRVP